MKIKSTFHFFSRCFSRSFLYKPISRLSCCVCSLTDTFISTVAFHDSSTSQSLGSIWSDIFSKKCFHLSYISWSNYNFYLFKTPWRRINRINKDITFFLWAVWQFFTKSPTFWFSESKYRYLSKRWFVWGRGQYQINFVKIAIMQFSFPYLINWPKVKRVTR